jgi:hypothetical protein
MRAPEQLKSGGQTIRPLIIKLLFLIRLIFPIKSSIRKTEPFIVRECQKRAMVRKVTGRLIRLPASLKKREFE